MMKTMRTRKSRNGFTLLELLIAVSLLAIGLLAVVSMQSVAMNANMVSNRLTVATTLAQQVAEDMLSWNISDPRLNSPGIPMPAAAAPNYIFINPSTGASMGTQIYIPGAGTYSARYSTTPNFPVNGTTVNGNTQIIMIVSYLSGSGPKDLVTYTVYKRVN
jgi:type IV pilus assembly protein PilV